MKLGLFAVGCVALQAWLAGGWLSAGVGLALCGLAWQVGWLRHGVSSFLLGGAGMALGGGVDRWLGLAASCHQAGLWSFSTLGMVLGCTAGCVAVCRIGGTSGFNPVMHALCLVGMFAGEQVAVVLADAWLGGAGHWTMAAGMAAGAATGAAIGGLTAAQERPKRRARAYDVGDGAEKVFPYSPVAWLAHVFSGTSARRFLALGKRPPRVSP